MKTTIEQIIRDAIIDAHTKKIPPSQIKKIRYYYSGELTPQLMELYEGAKAASLTLDNVVELKPTTSTKYGECLVQQHYNLKYQEPLPYSQKMDNEHKQLGKALGKLMGLTFLGWERDL
jgi:hypothetical protein